MREDKTIWTCDRCGLVLAQNDHRFPDDWARLTLVCNDPDDIVARDLCERCGEDLKKAAGEFKLGEFKP